MPEETDALRPSMVAVGMNCMILFRGRVSPLRVYSLLRSSSGVWVSASLLVILVLACAEPEPVRPSNQNVDLRLVERRLSGIEEALVRLEAKPEPARPSDQSVDLRPVERRLSGIEEALARLEARLNEVGVSDELPQWREGTTSAAAEELLKDCLRQRLAPFRTVDESEEEFEEGLTLMIDIFKTFGTLAVEEEADYLGFMGIVFGCWGLPIR